MDHPLIIIYSAYWLAVNVFLEIYLLVVRLFFGQGLFVPSVNQPGGRTR